jgi:5-methyltetrahydrofolate--homocysteine methyltransferase
VPAARILDEALAHKVDIVGLSGLITPSLDEMVFVAQEMERRGFDIPLLIGGATTSKTHTAVKIDPGYKRGSTTYVLDASRAVGVVSSLLSATDRPWVEAETAADYDRVREQFSRSQEAKTRTPLAVARQSPHPIDWRDYRATTPTFLGTRTFAPYDLKDLVRYIDWSPFFAAWELVGRFPDILQDDVVGEAARDLYKDAQEMLARIVEERWYEARGVVGIWPANSDGDDIVVWTDETRTTERARLHTLRQQMAKSAGRANVALADFIAPTGADYIGGFAVTAGHGEPEIAAKYKAAGDDYSAILAAALADRLAEAFAEAMHHKVRADLWGFVPGEPFDYDRFIAEKVQGIRPAPGYPAQPDHTEKAVLFDLLGATAATGITLTESFAMTPPASVSGLYFANPQAHYFGVGKIDRDQIADYAARKGWDVATAERWLSPILSYTP